MLRSHGQPPKAQPAQHRPHRPLGQHHPEPPFNLTRQVDPAPAHHPVLGQVWALPNLLGHLGLLRPCQPAGWTGRAAIRQPFKALGVIATHLASASVRQGRWRRLEPSARRPDDRPPDDPQPGQPLQIRNRHRRRYRGNRTRTSVPLLPRRPGGSRRTP